MDKLRIVDSGVAQITKQNKARLFGANISVSADDQDKVIYLPDMGIFAVSDGVGSTENGAEAAVIACRVFEQAMTRGSRLKTSQAVLDRIYQEGVLDQMQREVVRTGAAATFTGMVITEDGYANYLHVGDSQLLVRSRNLLQAGDVWDDEDDDIAPHTREQGEGRFLYNFLGVDYTGVGNAGLRLGTAPYPQQLAYYHNSHAEWGSLRLHNHDRLILVTDGVLGDQEEDRPTEEMWRDLTSRSLGAAAAAHALVHGTTKIDDSTAIVVDINGILENV